jgi:DNA-binding HxlR family transcriptional regulator
MRPHDQYCALARAVALVGDRWSLLVVRELWLGPKRFTDLANGLPGISRKLLGDRLRYLKREGVIERRQLPPPAARQVYVLTDDGLELAEAMVPLAAWGTRRLGRRRKGEAFRPAWAALGMAAFANRAAAEGVRETYEFRVGPHAFHVRVQDRAIEAHEGHATEPDLVVTTDERSWADIASGAKTVAEVATAGRLKAEGSVEASRNCLTIFTREAMGIAG